MRNVPEPSGAVQLPFAEWRVESVVVGPRFRREVGDLAELKEAIARHGVLQPIVVTRDRRLLGGQRCLEACRELGIATVPVHIVDVDDQRHAEAVLNIVRREYTPSERVEIAETFADVERARADANRRTAGPRSGRGHKTAAGKLPGPVGDVRDRLAKMVGWSGRTLQKAQSVIELARQKPESKVLARIVADMDASGNIDRAFKRAKDVEICARHCEDAEAIDVLVQGQKLRQQLDSRVGALVESCRLAIGFVRSHRDDAPRAALEIGATLNAVLHRWYEVRGMWLQVQPDVRVEPEDDGVPPPIPDEPLALCDLRARSEADGGGPANGEGARNEDGADVAD